MARKSIQNTGAERTRRRQPRPAPRRQGTRFAVITAATQEA